MILPLTKIIIGFSNLVFFIIALIVGLKLIIKYRNQKDKNYIFVGITWITVAMPYFATVVSFLYTLTTATLISFTIYIIISMTFFPIGLFLWIMAFTNLAYETHKNSIRSLIAVYVLIFEIILYILLFTTPSYLGEMIPPFIPRYEPYIVFNYLAMILVIIITGIYFSLQSLKSSDEKVSWKGKFLLVAFILTTIGGILDLVPTPDLVIFIKRTITITGSILFYLGFYLPQWVERKLIK